MRTIAYVTVAALLTAVVFIEAPRIDILVARQLFVEGRFWLWGDPVARAINRMIPIMVYAGSTALVVLTAFRLLGRPIAGCGLRAAGFLALSVLVGPGLIANTLLKSFSGRPRPFEITRFGGAMRFEPAFDFGGACPNNCSFVSGDASIAFALLAVALLVPRGRPAAILAALAFGAFIGIVRMAQGAHFLSDIVFAGFLTVLPILVLHHVLIERGWPRDPMAWRSFNQFRSD